MPPTNRQRNMQLIRRLNDLSPTPRAVAIGNFDGLHLGHQAVLAAMGTAATKHGLVPSVLTFEPHPRRFFQPKVPAFRLARLSDKLLGLQEAGVAQLVMPRFNAAFAAIPAEQFLEDALGKQLNARAVVTGENFTFGHKRGGDSALLRAWGKANDVEIITVPPVKLMGEVCSSSAIRVAVAMGDMHRVTRMLGRQYRLTGRVVHGDGRGRTIGFPTANIALPPGMLLPGYGVYSVRVTMPDGTVQPGVANLGIRPTVSVDKHPSLEVHLFDVMQELYGARLTVALVDRLRGELRFEGVEALRQQIAQDCATARAQLEGCA
jgi:riboflavin kinase/FMN adenylyltransferase